MNADLAHARAGSTSFWREADQELMAEAANLFGKAPEPPGLDGDKEKSDDDDDSESSGTATPPQAVPEPPPEPASGLENYAWKARVCVGLKVYSKDQELEVHVVMPKEDAPVDMVDLDSTNRDLHPEDTKGPGAKKGAVDDECTCGKSVEAGEKKDGKETDGGNKVAEREESGENKKGDGAEREDKSGEGDGAKGGAQKGGEEMKEGKESDGNDKEKEDEQKAVQAETQDEITKKPAQAEKDGKSKGKSTEGGSKNFERCSTCGKRVGGGEYKKGERSTEAAGQTEGKTDG